MLVDAGGWDTDWQQMWARALVTYQDSNVSAWAHGTHTLAPYSQAAPEKTAIDALQLEIDGENVVDLHGTMHEYKAQDGTVLHLPLDTGPARVSGVDDGNGMTMELTGTLGEKADALNVSRFVFQTVSATQTDVESGGRVCTNAYVLRGGRGG